MIFIITQCRYTETTTSIGRGQISSYSWSLAFRVLRATYRLYSSRQVIPVIDYEYLPRGTYHSIPQEADARITMSQHSYIG